MDREAERLAKRQGKALEAMTKKLDKAAKLAKPPRKAPTVVKINVVLPREAFGTTSSG
jgi:hypothetical protein